jgi:hypothetical protein
VKVGRHEARIILCQNLGYCGRSHRADAKCGGSTGDTRLLIFCMWGLALTLVDLRYEDEFKPTSTLHGVRSK